MGENKINYKSKYKSLSVLLTLILAVSPMKINNQEYRALPPEKVKVEQAKVLKKR